MIKIVYVWCMCSICMDRCANPSLQTQFCTQTSVCRGVLGVWGVFTAKNCTQGCLLCFSQGGDSEFHWCPFRPEILRVPANPRHCLWLLRAEAGFGQLQVITNDSCLADAGKIPSEVANSSWETAVLGMFVLGHAGRGSCDPFLCKAHLHSCIKSERVCKSSLVLRWKMIQNSELKFHKLIVLLTCPTWDVC